MLPESQLDTLSSRSFLPILGEKLKLAHEKVKPFEKALAVTLLVALLDDTAKNFDWHQNVPLRWYGHDFLIPYFYQYGSVIGFSALRYFRTRGKENFSNFSVSPVNALIGFALPAQGELFQLDPNISEGEAFDVVDFGAYALGSLTSYLLAKRLFKQDIK